MIEDIIEKKIIFSESSPDKDINNILQTQTH